MSINDRIQLPLIYRTTNTGNLLVNNKKKTHNNDSCHIEPHSSVFIVDLQDQPHPLLISAFSDFITPAAWECLTSTKWVQSPVRRCQVFYRRRYRQSPPPLVSLNAGWISVSTSPDIVVLAPESLGYHEDLDPARGRKLEKARQTLCLITPRWFQETSGRVCARATTEWLSERQISALYERLRTVHVDEEVGLSL